MSTQSIINLGIVIALIGAIVCVVLMARERRKRQQERLDKFKKQLSLKAHAEDHRTITLSIASRREHIAPLAAHACA